MRLFIGIDLPNEIKHAHLDFQAELRKLGVTGSWKSQENFHITLEFLGELDPNHIPTLIEALSKVTEHNKPFQLSINGLGAFPSIYRPHTLWTAVSGSLDQLNQLRDEIHVELIKNGFVLEERKFKPHITLASRPKHNDIDLSRVLSKKLGEFLVSEVVLFESKSIGGKRIYTDLDRISLDTSNA